MNRRKFIRTTSLVIAAGGIGVYWWPRRWKYIVVHHSASDFGTIEFLQQVHRERQSSDPIDAIPYHYVIGNGNGLGMGEIASDWRRDLNIWGAHVSRNNMPQNFYGLGICLIGNFENTTVPPGQFNALVDLTDLLMHRFNISSENVLGHGLIAGESTKCPGDNFPFEEFKSAISK